VTSTTDTAGHPDVEEISDLTEGLLPPSRTADLRRHLDDCSLCTDVYDSLEEIRGLLGSLPGPPPMPADIAGRIDAALAAEALLFSAAADEPGDESADEPSTASSGAAGLSITSPSAAELAAAALSESDRERVSRETSPSGVPVSGERPSGHGRAATGPGRTSRGRRPRRRALVVGGVLAVAALSLGGILLQSLNDDSSTGTTTTAQKQSSLAKEKLPKQVEELLAQNVGEQSTEKNTKRPWGATGEDDSSSAPPPTELNKTLRGNVVKIPDCVNQGIDRTEAPIAAKKGTYDGKSAYLVVLPNASDSTKVSAYVVDATCEKQSSASPGKVLLTQTYAKP